MNRPLISVIIPVYEVEAYLHKCIDSVIGQTYRELEIILVDDGSPDNCGDVCDEYAAVDSRIKVIHKQNGGLSDARNAGLDAASGEFIGFVDSDDHIEPDMFECLYQALYTSGSDISICNHIIDNEITGNMTSAAGPESESSLRMTQKEALSVLIDDLIIRNYMWNKLYRASLFEGLRFPAGKVFEDTVMQYRLFENSKNGIIIIKKELYHYVIRNNGIVRQVSISNILDLCECSRLRYEDLTSRHPEYSSQLLRQYGIRVIPAIRNTLDKVSLDTICHTSDRYNTELIPFVSAHRDQIEPYAAIPADEFGWLLEGPLTYRHKKSLKLAAVSKELDAKYKNAISEIDKLKKENKKLLSEKQKIKNSRSYRLGKMITCIPRKIRKAVE